MSCVGRCAIPIVGVYSNQDQLINTDYRENHKDKT